MIIRLLYAHEMTKHVRKISHLNFERLLRKLQKKNIRGLLYFAAPCRDDGFRRQTVKVEVRTGAIVKIPEFCSQIQNSIFRVLWGPSTILHTAYRKQFCRKPMVPMESRDSEGVPFAGLESL